MSGRFKIHNFEISGVKILERTRAEDARGFFERMFCVDDLKEVLAGRSIKQINQSLTKELGTVRGLHFQLPPHAETKIVSCIRGEIFDVVVDLRADSPTFLRWCGIRLSEVSNLSLLIPEGFAHGFQSLTPDAQILYFTTAAYDKEAERGLNAADPRLSIEWPNPISSRSAKDEQAPLLEHDFGGLRL